MIPKDGGNSVSGSIFFGGTDGNWQSDNVSDEMSAQKFTSRTASRTFRTSTRSMGGPIFRDKLWFFVSARHISTDEVSPTSRNSSRPTWSSNPSILDQDIRDVLGLVTWSQNEE